MKRNVEQITGFIFDLDGCIYSGDRIYNGSVELLTYLIAEGKDIYFLSNNSTDREATVRKKLMKMGLPVEDITILVATDFIGEYLLEYHGRAKLQVIGTAELKESLTMQGHRIYSLNDDELCDYVVVGRDPHFNYETLRQCVRAVMNGAKLIATNLDLYHPGEDGYRVPETGSLVAAIKAVSGVKDVPVVGKPFIYPFRKIIRQTGNELHRYVMIGDNPYTDVAGANEARLGTIWISHGEKFPEELDFRPNFVYSSMKELAKDFIPYHQSKEIVQG